MQVLMKSGRYAGELRDVRPDCAKQMVADGRAEDPRVVEIAVARVRPANDLDEYRDACARSTLAAIAAVKTKGTGRKGAAR